MGDCYLLISDTFFHNLEKVNVKRAKTIMLCVFSKTFFNKTNTKISTNSCRSEVPHFYGQLSQITTVCIKVQGNFIITRSKQIMFTKKTFIALCWFASDNNFVQICISNSGKY